MGKEESLLFSLTRSLQQIDISNLSPGLPQAFRQLWQPPWPAQPQQQQQQQQQPPPPPPPPSPPPPPPQPPQPEQLPTPRHDFYTTPNLVWCQGARGRHASFGKWLSKLLVKTGSKALNTRKTEKKNDVNLLFGLLQSTCFNLQLQLNGCFYFGLNPQKKGPFWKECSSSNHWFCRGQVSFSSEYIFMPDKSSLVKLHFVSKNRPHPQWSFGCFAFRVVAFFRGTFLRWVNHLHWVNLHFWMESLRFVCQKVITEALDSFFLLVIDCKLYRVITGW